MTVMLSKWGKFLNTKNEEYTKSKYYCMMMSEIGTNYTLLQNHSSSQPLISYANWELQGWLLCDKTIVTWQDDTLTDSRNIGLKNL